MSLKMVKKTGKKYNDRDYHKERYILFIDIMIIFPFIINS